MTPTNSEKEVLQTGPQLFLRKFMESFEPLQSHFLALEKKLSVPVQVIDQTTGSLRDAGLSDIILPHDITSVAPEQAEFLFLQKKIVSLAAAALENIAYDLAMEGLEDGPELDAVNTAVEKLIPGFVQGKPEAKLHTLYTDSRWASGAPSARAYQGKPA